MKKRNVSGTIRIWTDEEQEMLVDFVKKHKTSSWKECVKLADTINECIWDGKRIRSPKAVSLRTSKIRRDNKGKTFETAPAPKLPDPPKDEVNMAELGESIYDYIGSLKKKCQDLANAVASEQEQRKQTITHWKGIVADKDDTIARLNQSITNLNSRINNGGLTSNKKFQLRELIQ